MNAIECEELSKAYGRRYGVRGLDLSIPVGSRFGFLGPNGAGKTTTIRILLGFLRPSHGRALVFGRDCWRESRRVKQDVGYVPGDLRLYSWMTAKTALSISGQIRGVDLRKSGAELVDRFRLDPNVRVRAMSRGMRQKLGLILALSHHPSLLILDEPTSALDPLMQQTLYDILRERTDEGATVFFSSHTLSEVESLCDQVAILRNGELIAAEAIPSLRARARRVVMLQWGDRGLDGELPGFIQREQHEGNTWICSLQGPVMDFVRWSAGQDLRDVTISAPDLDRLFRQYYRNSGGDS